MTKFVVGHDTEIKSEEKTLEVTLDPANPLKIGKHVFQLIVVDDAGNPSAPATVAIVVVDKNLPTAVIEVINAHNERISTPSVQIPFQEPFTLTGDKSTDVGGVVKTYVWTLVE